MTQDRMTMLFFEMFTGLPRQGPGDANSTRRALSMVPGIGSHTRVLDIGCGTGAQTLEIARHTSSHIVAVDNHAPYIETLNREANAHGVQTIEDAAVGDMHQLV